MKFKFLFLTGLIILSMSLASAGFNFSGYKIDTSYSGGDVITGNFNMSFSNQKDANFSSSFGGEKRLTDLLDDSGYQAGDDYTCIPGNCEKGYSSSGGQQSRTIGLTSGETKKYGFVITGNGVEITDFTFDISSNIGNSCINQFSLDLFNDGERDFVNDKYVDELCGTRNYGCFKEADSSSDSQIQSQEYCEKITLSASPAYRVGAKIKNSTTGGDLKMGIYNMDGELLGQECGLPKNTQDFQDRDCIVNYSAKSSFEALVCVKATSGNYRIRDENKDTCGNWGADSNGDFDVDYEIYAQGLKYGAVNSKLNEEVYGNINTGQSLIDNLQEYIDEVYDGSCSPNCVIPFSIFGVTQSVTLGSLIVTYDTSSSGGKESKNIYDIEEQEFTINSSVLNFDISDLGFVAPNTTGKKTFKLSFDGQELFSKQINVSTGFIFDVAPRFALIGQKTLFKVVYTGNVTSTKWTFENNTVTSNNKETTYTFREDGDFDINVEVTNNKGEVSKKSFKINVGNAKDSANITIKRYETRIINITKEIDLLTSSVKDEVKKEVDVVELGNSLSKLKEDFNVASTDEEYLEVVNNLLELDIPYSISKSASGEVPAAIGIENIDTSYIEEISLKEAADSGDLTDSISSWMNENYDVDVNFETISAFGDGERKDILTKFKIKMNNKGDTEDDAYLIIGYPFENVKFITGEGKGVGSGSGTYVFFSEGNTNDVEFLVPEKISVEDLGIYLSPEITKLSLSEEDILPPGQDKTFKTKGFMFWIIVLLAGTLVLYIILQEWYKRNYEIHLFRDKDDLYNLINFVYNGRANGLDDGEVRRKLKSSSWSGEQINYAIRKLDGKRTGMWEIPIFKFFENRKVRDEIQRRQPGNFNARFIKEPRF